MRTGGNTPLPVGLKPPARHAPRRLRSTADLRTLQRLMTHTLLHPLVGPSEDDLTPTWRDGRPMTEVAAEFIKPNDRLTSFERLQIYARCYWYRVIQAVYDDCTALVALLGEKKFVALTQAYLTKYPSHSHSLRNISERLPQFILEQPKWTAPDTALAHQIARFEWAQTVAFDSEARPVLTRDDIADAPPAKLRLGLQPYLSLIEADWAIDDYVIAMKKRDALRADASNAVDQRPRAKRSKPKPRPKRKRVCIVVHRFENRLYYKRVEPAAFRILEALAKGRSLAQAIGGAGAAVTADQVRDWFATAMELGWFCRRK
jgi:hypothetical protein